ncbi:MAG: PD-(D/E)XK nuclease family protein, partial [Nanoarchaeota archaeon]|nr:PD-(D/E)XK nuclease family protein [Nanoarchaeota archaeon]
KTIEDAKYLDKKQELEKNIKKFEILIQQGKERFFFIPKYTAGTDTIPPYYFNFLYETNVEKYSSEIFDVKEIINNKEIKEFTNNPLSKSAEIKTKETISNTALNNFSLCPKKYSYSTLVSNLDKEVFLRGNLVHAFAEFYVNNQEFVKSKEIEEFVEIIMSNLKLMSNPFQNSILKTKIRFACIAIVNFIDNLKIDESLSFESFKEISRKNEENVFAKHYSKSMDKPNAELEFKDNELKLHGLIDLAVDQELIIDYKTSKDRKKVIDIVRNASLKTISSKCDFQPLVYLSVFRKITPNKKIQFWYNFPMTDIYEKIVGLELEEDNNVKVHYIPISFIDYIISKDFYDYFKETAPKYAEPILNLIEDFSYFKNKEIPEDIFEEPDQVSELLFEEFYQYLISLGLKD